MSSACKHRSGNSSAHISVVLLSDRLSLMCVAAAGVRGSYCIRHMFAVEHRHMDGFECALHPIHTVMRDKAVKPKYGLISLAHKVNLLYKSTYLLSPHQLSSGFLTPPLFHSLCIQSFFSSVPLISLKGEPLRGFKAAYTNSVELWHTHSKDVTLS